MGRRGRHVTWGNVSRTISSLPPLPAMSIYVINTPISSYQAYYFDRDDQALHNFAKFFRHQSHEEREHAEKLMKMQNQRGGRIFLQDVRV